MWGNGSTNVQVNWGGMSWNVGVDPGLTVITGSDPSFNADELLAFAQATYRRVNDARACDRLSDARPLVGEAMWADLQSRPVGKVVPQIVEIEHASIVSAQRDATSDTVTVRFAAKTDDKKVKELVEDWTFQRPAAQGVADPPTECPSCGAPLSTDDDGRCRYCSVPIAGVHGGWKLVRTATPNVSGAFVRSGLRFWWFFIIFMVVVAVVVPTFVVMFAVMRTTDSVTGALNPAITPRPAVSQPLVPVIPTPTTPVFAKQASLDFDAQLSGGVNGSTDGDVISIGSVVGSCAERSPNINGWNLRHTETSGGLQKQLTIVVNLPKGAKGPGSYDIGTDGSVTASLTGQPTAGSSARPSAETWIVDPAVSKAHVDFSTDGSAVITLSNLKPGGAFEPLSGVIDVHCK